MLIFEGPTENRQGELGSLLKYHHHHHHHHHHRHRHRRHRRHRHHRELKHSVVGKYIIEKQGQKRVKLGKNFYNPQEMLMETGVFDI